MLEQRVCRESAGSPLAVPVWGCDCRLPGACARWISGAMAEVPQVTHGVPVRWRKVPVGGSLL